MKCLFLRTFNKEYSQGFILFVRSKSLLSNRFVQLSHTNGDSNILIILRCSYKIKALRKAKYCVKSVRIRSFSGAYFPAFGLIRRDSPYNLYLSVLSANAGKYGPEKLRIRTLFTQCKSYQCPVVRLIKFIQVWIFPIFWNHLNLCLDMFLYLFLQTWRSPEEIFISSKGNI